jgi:hypothetical protein
MWTNTRGMGMGGKSSRRVRPAPLLAPWLSRLTCMGTAGTYTFPISFSIPSHMPPSLYCSYGSVSWRLKATVHRPGVLTAKMTATHDVTLVATPSEDDTEDTDSIVVERFWDDQMQYVLTVSGRMFSIGGTIPIDMLFLPMAKVKILRLSVNIEGTLPRLHVLRDDRLLSGVQRPLSTTRSRRTSGTRSLRRASHCSRSNRARTRHSCRSRPTLPTRSRALRYARCCPRTRTQRPRPPPS